MKRTPEAEKSVKREAINTDQVPWGKHPLTEAETVAIEKGLNAIKNNECRYTWEEVINSVKISG